MSKTTKRYDIGDDEDEAIFFSRHFGGKEIIIVPKQTDLDLLEVSETPTTYVITVTPKE